MMVTRGLGSVCGLVTAGLGVWYAPLADGWRETIRFTLSVRRKLRPEVER